MKIHTLAISILTLSSGYLPFATAQWRGNQVGLGRSDPLVPPPTPAPTPIQNAMLRSNNQVVAEEVESPPTTKAGVTSLEQQNDPMMTTSEVSCLQGDNGLVFTSSNAASGNELLVHCRAPGGTLNFGGGISTGGVGGSAGSVLDPLGSNHPITLSPNGRCAFVVNAGSNTLTSFAIDRETATVERKQQYSSGGIFPVTIATTDGFAYVLNSGGDGSIVPFILEEEGCTLQQIPDGIRSLEFDHTNPPDLFVSPGSIKLTPDQKRLVLTIKGFNQGLIVLYELDEETGVPGRGTYQVSSGFTPFSIDFDPNGNLLITEETGAAPEPPLLTQLELDENLGAVSSYRFTEFGTLVPISQSIPNGEAAPCWSAIQDRCLFVANVVSGTISSYYVTESGEVVLANPVAATVPGAIDLFINDGMLFALSSVESLPEDGGTTPSLFSFMVMDSQGSCELAEISQTFDGLPNTDVTENGVTGLTVLTI